MIKIIGVPFDANSTFLRGAALGPEKIRQMDAGGSANRFTERGFEIIPGETYQDLGNIPFEIEDPRQAFQTIETKISLAIGDGSKLISLGGDHSITFPIVKAHLRQYPNLHILHLDAHGDLYHDYDGNPFSHASPFARILELGQLASLTQVGIRTLNSHQWKQAIKFGVQVIEMKDHHLSKLKALQGPLYISLDLDALDPAFAPGVSHHEPGGFTTREILSIFHQIDVPVIGGDIVECNPSRDTHDMTAMVAYKFMKEMIELLARS